MLLHSDFPAKSIRFYSDCPCCGGKVTCPAPRDLTRLIELTEIEEAILEVFWRSVEPKMPASFVATFQDFYTAMYRDDEDGGPDEAVMRKAANSALKSLAGKIGASFGVDFLHRPQVGVALKLSAFDADQAMPRPIFGKSSGSKRQFVPVPCPCCSRTVPSPSLEMVMHNRSLMLHEKKVLAAIDSMHGLPVHNEHILAVLNQDSPSPPSPRKQYRVFVETLSSAKTKLQGSGVVVQNLGHGMGYVIVSEIPGSAEVEP